jgi:hypothetical protein
MPALVSGLAGLTSTAGCQVGFCVEMPTQSRRLRRGAFVNWNLK